MCHVLFFTQVYKPGEGRSDMVAGGYGDGLLFELTLPTESQRSVYAALLGTCPFFRPKSFEQQFISFLTMSFKESNCSRFST